jgi:multisubunit Na+/H+ antiporter MnhF subunit
MSIPNKVYDVLKWIALVALDAIGVFYQALAMIWGLPFGDEVLATCASVSLLLGTLIGISSNKYNKINKGEE